MHIGIKFWNFKRYFTIELRKELNRVHFPDYKYTVEELISIVLISLENTFNRIIVDVEPFPIPALTSWNTNDKSSIILIEKNKDSLILKSGVDNESSSMR